MKMKSHNRKENESFTFDDKLKKLAVLSETEPERALKEAKELLKQHSSNVILLTIAGNSAKNNGMISDANSFVDKALELEPEFLFALRVKASLEIDDENYKKSLPYLEKANNLYPEDAKILFLLMLSLLKSKRYDDVFKLYKKSEGNLKNNTDILNVYGNTLLGVARVKEAIDIFQKGLKENTLNASVNSNLIVALHYSTEHTPEQILNECKLFQERFRSTLPINRAVSKKTNFNKKIRIGMISDGFRAHPVGSMITYGLTHIPEEEIEFFAYSTNNESDHVTEKIKKICTKWEVIEKLTDNELDQLIRNDEIDILFDLAGFNSNTRAKTIMMEPAPIIVKWVGGLISSTGLDAVDYLLSDRIETPLGSDDLYTEKLIRLPDDYICFKPPFYTPPVKDLPVLRNGYVTFACFNNASKINDSLLEQWAGILNALPNSRLFLKSQGYASSELCQKIYSFFESKGITQERIRLEPEAPHRELLECYNEVDIALDPWPYSGGLTTCEALIMGVPVITLPGPTFAGRHSATHLVNAGMPELVAEDWEHYQNLAITLANDVENLNTIRQNLRFIVLQSPLCDGERFSRSFSNAMRAIWQRHCAGKKPEALVLSDEQIPYFADEEGPVELMHPEPVAVNNKTLKSEVDHTEQQDDFRFDFTGRIVTVDNGTNLVKRNYFPKLVDFDAFSFVLFDPAGEEDKQQFPIDQSGSIQHFPFHALGNGEKTNLYVCVDASQSSTLVPINKNLLKTGEKPDPTTVVAEIPVFTVKADGIAGLTHIDWLLLSGRYEVLSILSRKNRLSSNALLIQVNIPADMRYEGQPGIDTLKNHLAELGYTLLRINGNKHQDSCGSVEGIKKGLIGSHMTEYSLIFVPNAEKINQLNANQREKLAFILHNAYGIHDFTYHVLAHDNVDRARIYLEELELHEKKQEQDAKFWKEKNRNISVNNKKTPILSIVMPVFNVGPYLDACLLSVRYQTFSDFELIIVNDASTDNGREIIEMHAALDSRISLINLEHNTLGGAGIPSNIGIDAATGVYVGFVDSDDWVSATAFERMVAAAEKHRADIVIGSFRTFVEHSRDYSEAYDLKVFEAIPTDTAFTARECPNILGLSPVPWRKLYRRAFLEKHAIRYPEGDYFYEDNPLHWFVLSSHSRITKIDDVISYHRMAREGQTVGASDYKWAAMCSHVNTIGRFLNKELTSPSDQLIFDVFYNYCLLSTWVLQRQTRPEVKSIVGKQFAKIIKRNIAEHPPKTKRIDFDEKIKGFDAAYPDYDLTIVIPAYNCEEFIEETVNSALNTPGIKTNILVMDDGSSDRTPEICRQLEKKHNNVHFFEQKNKGAGRARNALIPLCTGRYTFFLDADDVIDGKALAQSVIDATKNDNDLYFMKYKISFHEKGKERDMFDADKTLWGKFTSAKDNNQLRILAAELINFAWNRIIKTELLLDANIFFGATVVHNDIAFHWDSLLVANRIGYTNNVVCTHRQFDQRTQITNVSDYRCLLVFDALEFTHHKIQKHENGKDLTDTWVNFARNLIKWVKDRIPEELQPQQYQLRRTKLLNQLITLQEERNSHV
ncbi:MAG: glycosyltransferase [Alcaligenaceae bacterium]|jgi:predicted O-linked N-acetylglucosamine transferase (SPINDLY family)/glycosyltransferase involved in cell wall biosynthesis|nr:glycosyltransferase [Alcaligenaceae bacterium]